MDTILPSFDNGASTDYMYILYVCCPTPNYAHWQNCQTIYLSSVTQQKKRPREPTMMLINKRPNPSLALPIANPHICIATSHTCVLYTIYIYIMLHISYYRNVYKHPCRSMIATYTSLWPSAFVVCISSRLISNISDNGHSEYTERIWLEWQRLPLFWFVLGFLFVVFFCVCVYFSRIWFSGLCVLIYRQSMNRSRSCVRCLSATPSSPSLSLFSCFISKQTVGVVSSENAQPLVDLSMFGDIRCNV